jgi:hypothetical protein
VQCTMQMLYWIPSEGYIREVLGRSAAWRIPRHNGCRGSGWRRKGPRSACKAYGELGRRARACPDRSAHRRGGRIKPMVTTVLPLSEARRTQEMREGRHTRGKIVLRVAEDPKEMNAYQFRSGRVAKNFYKFINMDNSPLVLQLVSQAAGQESMDHRKAITVSMEMGYSCHLHPCRNSHKGWSY